MSQPTYKLYYFDIRGLGEQIRILLAYGGIEYEDIRITQEEWPAIKPTMPFGQIPVLEVDGTRVYQSTSITRYLAKHVGLAGADDWESLLIDIAVDNLNEFDSKLVAAHYEKDDAIKAIKLAAVKDEILPFYLDKFESFAKENNGHLALGKLTWADIFFVAHLDFFNMVAGFNVIADRPNLQNVVSNVSNVESIKAWFEKRPDSLY
ncbi:glutathione S-transferase-like isoform X2 [Sitodiplosis mosellana]|nr:glutathione S-transferase-like isoform X2 [Sitodiplosis mosellana]XP_055298071.1 glutathione S-transferase-like isoform X2 [Sitodiplosis mosellana]